MNRGHPRNWYKQKENHVRGYWLKKPYNKIMIGCDPLDGMTTKFANSFDVILNVSCTECAVFYPSYDGQHMYWIPVNEMGVWNYSAFVQFVKIMDFHYKKNHKIYVHCHAGAYRSPTMTMIWLYVTQKKPYKFGKHDLKVDISWEDAYRMSKGLTEEKYKERFPEEKGLPFRLKYFRGNMPKNFNFFIEKLKHHRNKNYTYTACLDGAGGKVSNDREVRAKIQGYKLSERIKRPFRKISYSFKNLKAWFELLMKGEKRVSPDRCFTTTIEGDDWLRTQIRKRLKK